MATARFACGSREHKNRRGWRGRPDIVVLRPRPRQGNDKNLSPPLSPVLAQRSELIRCGFAPPRSRQISSNPNSLGRSRSGGNSACSVPPAILSSNSGRRAWLLRRVSRARYPALASGRLHSLPVGSGSSFDYANSWAVQHSFLCIWGEPRFRRGTLILERLRCAHPVSGA